MKKKVLRRVLVTVLAGAMSASILSGCGSKPAAGSGSDSAAPESAGGTSEAQSSVSSATSDSEGNTAAGMEGWEPFTENVTITVPVYDRAKAGYPAVDDNYWTRWIQSEFGDKWNITVKYVPIPRSEVMENYARLIAAQNTPTIMMEYDYPKVTQWANDGAMTTIDLDAFKQVAPTYYQKMVENDQLGYTDVNGETYFVLSERPYYNTPYSYVRFCRMDWLRQVGYDHVPQNYDEYSDAVNKIIAEGICSEPIQRNLPSGAYIENFGYREFPVAEEEWVQHSSLGTPGFTWEPTYRMLKKYNSEYHQGWYSKEFDLDLDTTAGSQAETDFINGELFEYGQYMSANVSWLTAFYEKNPDAELAVVSNYRWVDGEYQLTPALRADNPFGMIVGFSALATDDQLKAAWMLMEWMIQPDVLFYLENGEEGVNFEYDENGIAVQINLENTGNEMMMNHNCNIDMTCLVHAIKTVGNGIEDAIKAITPQGIPQDFTQEMIDFYYEQKDIADAGMAYSDPVFAVSIESESEYSATLLSKWQEYFVSLVKCAPEEFDSLYEQYKKEFLDAGYQEIIDDRMEAYENGQTTHLPDKSKK